MSVADPEDTGEARAPGNHVPAWLYAIGGIAVSLLATYGTVKIQVWLFLRLLASEGTTPTFHSGEQWFLLGLVLTGGAAVLTVHLALLAIALPIRFAYCRLRVERIRLWPYATAGAAAASLLSLILMGWGGTHILLALFGVPFLASVLLTVTLATWWLNRTLAREQAHPPDDGTLPT